MSKIIIVTNQNQFYLKALVNYESALDRMLKIKYDIEKNEDFVSFYQQKLADIRENLDVLRSGKYAISMSEYRNVLTDLGATQYNLDHHQQVIAMSKEVIVGAEYDVARFKVELDYLEKTVVEFKDERRKIKD